jgi:hypothetical protein
VIRDDIHHASFDVLATEILFRGQCVVSTAAQPQVRELTTATLSERISVIDFQVTRFATALSAFIDVGTSALVALKYRSPFRRRDVARSHFRSRTALARVLTVCQLGFVYRPALARVLALRRP